MKRDYTGKYTVGQTVYINDKRNYHHGRQFTIQSISAEGKRSYPYQLSDGLWYPEGELSAEPPTKPQQQSQPTPQKWQTMDIDSGLGISGINNDQAAPVVPSVETIERMQHLHDTDTVCRRCGASKHFDGTMFSTFGGGDICDDCA